MKNFQRKCKTSEKKSIKRSLAYLELFNLCLQGHWVSRYSLELSHLALHVLKPVIYVLVALIVLLSGLLLLVNLLGPVVQEV